MRHSSHHVLGALVKFLFRHEFLLNQCLFGGSSLPLAVATLPSWTIQSGLLPLGTGSPSAAAKPLWLHRFLSTCKLEHQNWVPHLLGVHGFQSLWLSALLFLIQKLFSFSCPQIPHKSWNFANVTWSWCWCAPVQLSGLGSLCDLTYTTRLSPRRGGAGLLWSLCLSWEGYWFPYSQSELCNTSHLSWVVRLLVWKEMSLSRSFLQSPTFLSHTTFPSFWSSVSSVIIYFLIMTSGCAEFPRPPSLSMWASGHPHKTKHQLIPLAARPFPCPPLFVTHSSAPWIWEDTGAQKASFALAFNVDFILILTSGWM